MSRVHRFPKCFELSTLINKNVSDLYKNQNVDFSVDKEIYLRGRPDYFSIVMQNLINNALKYSGKNHVNVSIIKNKDCAKILVEDHGIGRSEEHTSELQSHSFISYAVFCLKKKNKK